MLVEIPDPEVILSCDSCIYCWIRWSLWHITRFVHSSKQRWYHLHIQSERLEYYERQLIDMKIRLDALEIQGIGQKSEDPSLELKQFLEKLAKE